MSGSGVPWWRSAARILLLSSLAALLPQPQSATAQVIRRQDAPAQGPVATLPADHDTDSDMPLRRMEWFYAQRTYPLGYIPAGARLKAALAVERMITAQRGSAAGANVQASTSVWTLVGPQPTGSGGSATSGRISAVAVDPRNSNVVYLGGAQGGVWKTTDGGVTWRPLTDGQASLAIGSIALDPQNPDVVYVGTGEGNFSGDSYYGAGVLKSTDGGNSWTLIQGPFAGPNFGSGGARIGSIAVHPTNSSIVLAAVQGNPSGIYRSIDGGLTWTNVLTGAYGTGVLFDPTNPNIVYAALGTIFAGNPPPKNGIYKSTDTGQTWTQLDPGGSVIPTVGTGRIVLAIAPSSPQVLYASIQATNPFGYLLGVYKTSDGGQSWTKLGPNAGLPDYCLTQCWYDNVVAIHPTNANVVFLGGSGNSGAGLLRSLDGGATWKESSRGANGVTLHVDHHAMAYSSDGAVFYEGNDGGAWKTTDAANATINWTNLNSTLSLTQFEPGGAIHPSTPDVGLGGTQDNNVERYSGSIAWQSVTCGDGGWAAFDAAAPYTAYSECQALSVQRSNSLGASGSWFDITPPVPGDESMLFYPPLIADPSPSASGTIYLGTQRVWQSRDGGTTWAPISPKVTNSPVVSAMGVAPTNSNTVYAGYNTGKVWVSTTALSGANATWTERDTGLLNRYVTQIAVDPANEATAYVSFSGFDSGTNVGHIFKTTNTGVSWTNITGNLPNIPVNDLVVDPDVANTLYAGTDVGVFSTSDGGTTWAPLMTGLPHVAVFSLKLHRAARILRAATHGRSVWDLKLANFTPGFGPTSMNPISAAAGTPALTLTVEGNGFTQQSQVTWNGSQRTTTFVSATQLQAAISSADLSVAGLANVAVTDPNQSAASAALGFSIMNPQPSMSGLSPNLVAAGSGPFTLQVNGSNFVGATSVVWNGASKPTTLVSGNQLSATIPASDTAEAGYAAVNVFTGAPGGGKAPAGFYLVTVRNPVPPPNDNYANATLINTGTYSNVINNFGATQETTDPVPCAGNGYGSAWWRFTATQNGTATLDTIGTNYGIPYVILGAYTGSAGSFTQVACNFSLSGQARVSFPVIAGTTYSIMISGYFSYNVGHTQLNATLPVSGPPPVVNSISPTSAVAGASGLTLTATGSNFVSGAAVLWNGSKRPTTFVSATQLTAAIAGFDLASGGTAAVTVMNPDGGTSAPVSFSISNAVPRVSAVSPGTVGAGSPGFTLAVQGMGFAQGAAVRWNGADRSSTYVSANEVRASIAAADVVAASSVSVSVANPSPGGGTSGTLPLTVANSVPPPAQLPAKPVLRYIPHYVSGNGFISKLTVTNLANAINNIVVNVLAQDGTLVSSANFNVAPAATLRIDMPESLRAGVPVTQWVIVGADANVTANVFFEVAGNNNPLNVINTVGYSDSPLGTDFTFPVEFEPTGAVLGKTVGIAIANPANAAVTITITVLDRVGTAIGSKTLVLPAFGQTALDLTNVPEISAGLPGVNMVGAVTVSATSSVTVIGLGDDRGPFYSIDVAGARAK